MPNSLKQFKHFVSPGHILWCINWPKYPEKPRPVLVLRRINDIDGVDYVLVAYGSGQRTSEKNGQLNQYCLEINSNDCTKYDLKESTVFKFDCVIPLELSTTNFNFVYQKLKEPHFQQAGSIFNSVRTKFKNLI